MKTTSPARILTIDDDEYLAYGRPPSLVRRRDPGYVCTPMPITMKQLTTLQDSLIGGLRGVYEMECKLSAPVDNIIHSTPELSLKAEFVVYLNRLRKNVKQIEYIFCLLRDRPLLRSEKVQVETPHFSEYQMLAAEAISSCITPLQQIIHYKTLLYQDLYMLAVKLNQPRIASILHEIFEFEKDTEVILSEIKSHEVKYRVA